MTDAVGEDPIASDHRGPLLKWTTFDGALPEVGEHLTQLKGEKLQEELLSSTQLGQRVSSAESRSGRC